MLWFHNVLFSRLLPSFLALNRSPDCCKHLWVVYFSYLNLYLPTFLFSDVLYDEGTLLQQQSGVCTPLKVVELYWVRDDLTKFHSSNLVCVLELLCSCFFVFQTLQLMFAVEDSKGSLQLNVLSNLSIICIIMFPTRIKVNDASLHFCVSLETLFDSPTFIFNLPNSCAMQTNHISRWRIFSTALTLFQVRCTYLWLWWAELQHIDDIHLLACSFPFLLMFCWGFPCVACFAEDCRR